MALTNDYALELPDRSHTIGLAADAVQVRLEDGGGGIAGVLGTPDVTQRVEPRTAEDGDIAGIDTHRARLIIANVQIVAATPTAAGQAAQTMRTAWRVQRTDEIPLDVRWPGSPETTMRYFGRPLGAEEQTYLLPFGAGFWRVSFNALDPLAYGAEVSETNETAQFEVTNAGTATTRRVTVELTSDGVGPMSLAHEDGRTIAWAATLPNSTVRNVDLRAGTVTDGSGVSKIGEVTWSEWWDLAPGEQDLTPTNCTVDVTWRPAWL